MSFLKKLLILPFLIFLAAFSFAQTAVKDYVCIVHEQFSERQIEMYTKFAQYFAKSDYSSLTESIKKAIKPKSFGSGFVYVDKDGNNYVITNNHVASVGEFVSVEFENSNGKKKNYADLKLVARDAEIDVAVFQFTKEKPFNEGLKIITKQQTENTEVYSAGFPGIGQKPLWQFGKGITTNVNVTEEGLLFDPSISSIIQHSAQVDPGNSGGPLLIKDSSAVTGFSVIGINTAQAYYRQAANYAIPAQILQDFIDSAIHNKKGEYYNKPELKAERLAKAFNAKDNSFTVLRKFISHDIINDKNLKEHAETVLNKKGNSGRTRNFISYFPVSSLLSEKSLKIWDEYNTIEKKEKSEDEDFYDDEENKEEELPDIHFYKITKTEYKNNNFEAILTDEEDKALIKTIWVYENGSWMLSEIDYLDKGKRAKKENNGKSYSNSFFTIGFSKHLKTDIKDYDGNKRDFDVLPSFELSFGGMMDGWLSASFDYIYQVTEMDTMKLFGAGLGLQLPVNIKSLSIYPFAKSSAYYTLFSDAAAYAYSYEGGIRMLYRYGYAHSDGFGIQSSLRYLEISSLNRRCNDYKNVSLTVSAIFLTY